MVGIQINTHPETTDRSFKKKIEGASLEHQEVPKSQKPLGLPKAPSANLREIGKVQQSLDNINDIAKSKIYRGADIPENVQTMLNGLEKGQIPEPYQRIADRYGNTTPESFQVLHHRQDICKSGETISYQGMELEPMSAGQFKELLQTDIRDSHKEYLTKYRAQGNGGCGPINEDLITCISGKGYSAGNAIITAHIFTVVNVEGIVYGVDPTFNQFLEKTTFTKWGPPPQQGQNVGVIVMPLMAEAHLQNKQK